MSKKDNQAATGGYIAKVLVTCYVDGQRTDVQPGEPVPDLPKHDVEQLLKIGAISDPEVEAAEEKAAERQAKAASKPFAEAKAAVKAADASIAADGAVGAGTQA